MFSDFSFPRPKFFSLALWSQSMTYRRIKGRCDYGAHSLHFLNDFPDLHSSFHSSTAVILERLSGLEPQLDRREPQTFYSCNSSTIHSDVKLVVTLVSSQVPFRGSSSLISSLSLVTTTVSSDYQMFAIPLSSMLTSLCGLHKTYHSRLMLKKVGKKRQPRLTLTHCPTICLQCH